MSDTKTPPDASGFAALLQQHTAEIEAITARVRVQEALDDVHDGRMLDISERLDLMERRLGALAAYFREAAYVL